MTVSRSGARPNTATHRAKPTAAPTRTVVRAALDRVLNSPFLHAIQSKIKQVEDGLGSSLMGDAIGVICLVAIWVSLWFLPLFI